MLNHQHGRRSSFAVESTIHYSQARKYLKIRGSVILKKCTMVQKETLTDMQVQSYKHFMSFY